MFCRFGNNIVLPNMIGLAGQHKLSLGTFHFMFAEAEGTAGTVNGFLFKKLLHINLVSPVFLRIRGL